MSIHTNNYFICFYRHYMGKIMGKMLCSLCGNVSDAQALDMQDFVFGNYVRLVRKLGISKHKGELGICNSCMERYKKYREQHQKRIVLYGTLAVVLGVVYLYLTLNLLVTLAIVLMFLGLSSFSYCPPLKNKIWKNLVIRLLSFGYNKQASDKAFRSQGNRWWMRKRFSAYVRPNPIQP